MRDLRAALQSIYDGIMEHTQDFDMGDVEIICVEALGIPTDQYRADVERVIAASKHVKYSGAWVAENPHRAAMELHRLAVRPRLPANVLRYKIQQNQGEYCLKACEDGDLVDYSAYEALLRSKVG